jgi:hypothetical protein
MKRENIRVRYGVSDIVLTKKEDKKFNGTIELDNPVLSEASFYFDEEEGSEIRYAGEDVILDMDEMDQLNSKYITAKEGQVVSDVELYFVCYEDEDGNELDQEEVDEFLKQDLVDQVIEEMRRDFNGGDLTAIDELLKHVDDRWLRGYLPEKGL